jgi:hypothetical protein
MAFTKHRKRQRSERAWLPGAVDDCISISVNEKALADDEDPVERHGALSGVLCKEPPRPHS